MPLLARRAASATERTLVYFRMNMYIGDPCVSVPAPRIKAYRAAAGLGPTSEMGQTLPKWVICDMSAFRKRTSRTSQTCHKRSSISIGPKQTLGCEMREGRPKPPFHRLRRRTGLLLLLSRIVHRVDVVNPPRPRPVELDHRS